MRGPSVSRRGFMAGGLTIGAAALLESFGGSTLVARAAATAPARSDLGAIEHVVMLMLENRSFDHCFGVYPGVQGFNDHPAGSLGPFSQAWPQSPARLATPTPFSPTTSTWPPPWPSARTTPISRRMAGYPSTTAGTGGR